MPACQERGSPMQPDVRVQHCTDGAAARITRWPPSCFDPTAIPGLSVVWALSKGIERGTRLHATEEPHARIHPSNARSLAIGTTITERSYIIPRWCPISQELIVCQPVCYGSSDPMALRHRTLAQRTPTSTPTTRRRVPSYGTRLRTWRLSRSLSGGA
jgi:hypothetical protein